MELVVDRKRMPELLWASLCYNRIKRKTLANTNVRSLGSSPCLLNNCTKLQSKMPATGDSKSSEEAVSVGENALLLFRDFHSGIH